MSVCSRKFGLILCLLILIVCHLEVCSSYSIGRCQQFKNRNDIHCYDSFDNFVPCNTSNHEIGSKIVCKPFYHSKNGFPESTCMSDGEWSIPEFQCTTDCGKVDHKNMQNPRPFIATIYQMVKKNLYVPICRGTLISEKHVITSAFCILNHKDKVLDIEDISIGFPALDSTKYNVKFLNYSSEDTCQSANETDLAIFTLEKELTLNDSVLPICLLSCGQIEEIALKNGSLGEVMLRDGEQAKFQVHFYPECETLGVFCAKGKELGVEETGTPLIVPMIDFVYFLEGILSPRISTIKNDLKIQHCEDSKTFTRIFPHIQWIRSVMEEESAHTQEKYQETVTIASEISLEQQIKDQLRTPLNPILEFGSKDERISVAKSRRRDPIRDTVIELKSFSTEDDENSQVEMYVSTTEQTLLQSTGYPFLTIKDALCENYDKEWNPANLSKSPSTIQISNSKIDTNLLFTTLFNNFKTIEFITIEHSCLTTGFNGTLKLPNLKNFTIRDTQLEVLGLDRKESNNYFPFSFDLLNLLAQKLNIHIEDGDTYFVLSFKHELIAVSGWQNILDELLDGNDILTSANWKSMVLGNLEIKAKSKILDNFPTSLTSLYLINITMFPEDMKTLFYKNTKLEVVYFDSGNNNPLVFSVFNSTSVRGMKLESGNFVTEFEDQDGWYWQSTKKPLTVQFKSLTHLYIGQNVSFDADIVNGLDQYFVTIEKVAFRGSKDNFLLVEKILKLKSLEYFLIRIRNPNSDEAKAFLQRYNVEFPKEARNMTYNVVDILFTQPSDTTGNLVSKVLNSTEFIEHENNFFKDIFGDYIYESFVEL